MNKSKITFFVLISLGLLIFVPASFEAEQQTFEVYPLDKQGGAIPLFQDFGVEAVEEDLSEFCVSDPFVNYAGLAGVKHYYSVTSEDLYNAYIAAGSGFVIEDYLSNE